MGEHPRSRTWPRDPFGVSRIENVSHGRAAIAVVRKVAALVPALTPEMSGKSRRRWIDMQNQTTLNSEVSKT